MGFFKKKVVKDIGDSLWGHLFNVHKIDVDTLSKDMGYVEREGVVTGGKPGKFLRVFKLSELQHKGITVTGWETFDQHPDLILFEGYLTKTNEILLERKNE
jgi:hypothetical protein